MHLPVPYFSQYRDVKDPEWQFRSCSIVNLKMMLEYMKAQYPDRGVTAPSVEELIEEGVELKGYTADGWVHDVVAMLARNHGCNAYREEFRSRDAAVERRLCDEGVEKIRYTIETGFPVMASVKPGFSPAYKDFHTVLFTGVHDDGFHYHDPAMENEALGAGQFVSEEHFLQFWRKFAIFVY